MCMGVCVYASVSECVCPLQSLKADGAEEEDGVQQQETESQPAVQLPAVQMDTQHLDNMRRCLLLDTWTT